MCSKTKVNTPLMYEVLNKDAMKYEILPHLSVEKRGYVSKGNLTEVIQRILYKPGNWLSMADYFCVCMILSSLAMSSMLCNRSCCGCKRRCFLCRCPCACMQQNCFCLVFGVGFNIMSALFVLQSPTLPQIIDSRAGLF